MLPHSRPCALRPTIVSLVTKQPRELERPLYAVPTSIPPLTAARGSIVVMDWQALREHGLFDAYVAAVSAQPWAALGELTTGSWVPLELLREHYLALDSLQLQDALIRDIGREVGERVHGAFLLTLIRLAGKCGMSPWLALEQTYKLWTRTWNGGSIVVHRVGATHARIALSDAPVCHSRFFCTSLAGVIHAGLAPFGRDLGVELVSGGRSGSTVSYRVSWQG
jgi:hypothetical protein